MNITYEEVVEATARLAEEANFHLPPDVKEALRKARDEEPSPRGRRILEEIVTNFGLAEQGDYPLCQDTGTAVVFVELGQEAVISGGSLITAIEEGVRRGYTRAHLRPSMVRCPFKRENTGDNSPPVIHVSVVPGRNININLLAKGAGSENVSRLAMFPPAAGWEGIKKFVLETVSEAGPHSCPPLVVGIGIGGNFETCALLAKRALLRPLGNSHPSAEIADREQELLSAINALGIGPMGFGGQTTALAVHIETYPCHIASLPVAVNISCHSLRHKSVLLGE